MNQIVESNHIDASLNPSIVPSNQDDGSMTTSAKKKVSFVDDDSSKVHSPGLWRYSKTRQLTFWIKNSVREVITPDLNSVYESQSPKSTFEDKLLSNQNNSENVTSFDLQVQKQEHDNISSDYNAYCNNSNNNNNDSDSDDDDESIYEYPPCHNIDDAMCSLHSLLPDLNSNEIFRYDENDESRTHKSSSSMQHEYDWMLDGDIIVDEDEETNTQQLHMKKKKKKKKLGVEELDCALAIMELECSPSTSKSFTAEDDVIDNDVHNQANCHSVQQENEDCALIDNDDSSICFSLPQHMYDTPRNDYRSFTKFDDDSCRIDDYECILDHLPFEQPTTPEGKFYRYLKTDREQLDHSIEDDDNIIMSEKIHELPLQYFTDDHDPILEAFKSIPWGEEKKEGNDPSEFSERDADINMFRIDDFMSQKLSHLDEMSQGVTQNLLSHIHKHNDEIQEGTRRLQAIDCDVTLALGFAKEADSYLQRAKGRDKIRSGGRGGIDGGIHIIEDASRRDKVSGVNSILKTCEELFEMERSIRKSLEKMDATSLTSNSKSVISLIEKCKKLKLMLLYDDRIFRLSCMDDFRKRVSHIMQSLSKHIDDGLLSFVSRRCNSFDSQTSEKWNEDRSKEFASLLNARCVLHEYHLLEVKENMKLESPENNVAKPNIAHDWSDCILKALCFEADRCLARALLDPTSLCDNLDEKTSDFDENLMEIRFLIDKLQVFDEDAASLRSMTKNLLSIRFEFENRKDLLPWVLHKFCSLLADVMYTHYMLTQWHELVLDDNRQCESPFGYEAESVVDERNSICTKDDNTADQTKSTHSSNGSRSSSSSTTLSFSSPQQSLHIPQCITASESMNSIHDKFLSTDPKTMNEIYRSLVQTKLGLWEHCKSLLVSLIKASVDVMKKNNNDNFEWVKDLEINHDMVQLCHQMTILAQEFVGQKDNDLAKSPYNAGIKCDLKAFLVASSENYIHGVHVQAMTDIGTIMANDDWEILPVPLLDSYDNDDDDNDQHCPTHRMRCGVELLLKGMLHSDLLDTQASVRPWQNLFKAYDINENLFAIFSSEGNPFSISACANSCHQNIDLFRTQCGPSNNHNLYMKICQNVCQADTEFMIGTKAALDGIGRWTVRLLFISQKLPIIHEKISGILTNIYDLYFLTVFRICTGDAVSEDIILGNSKRSDTVFNERFPQDIPPSRTQLKAINSKQPSALIGKSFSRRLQLSTETFSQSFSLEDSVSEYCNADMYSPLPSEESDLIPVRKFLRRAQASLSGMVCLDQIDKWSLVSKNVEGNTTDDCVDGIRLQKRVSASLSCMFITCLFDTTCHSFGLNHGPDSSSEPNNTPLKKYLNQMAASVNHMHLLCLRTSTMRAIKGRDIVMKVLSIGDGWTKSELHTQCNDYVDPLVETCISLSQYLSASKLSFHPWIITDTWNQIIESGFLALLEGFSKVYDCSTEGRALMSIDLATFCSSLPGATPKRGMQYVDMFIKVFYFPEEDVMKWIADNKNDYHLYHLMALVSFGAHNQLSSHALSKLSMRRKKIKNI